MSSAFDELLDLARRIGMGVRHVHLGGSGGGLAMVKGQRVLFIDIDAHPQDQLERAVEAMAGLAELENVFVRADVRELLDKRSQGT